MKPNKIIAGITGWLLLLITIIPISNGQEQNAASWRFSAKKIDERTFEVRIRANISKDWHIYAQDIAEGTALPTTVSFDPNPLVILLGKTSEEGKPEEKREEGVLLKYYCTQVDFVQIVKLRADVKTAISGKVNFMVCTDKRCLPPSDKDFSIVLDGRK